jgi:hypothetical protein
VPLRLGLGDNLAVGLVNHPNAIHERDLRHLIAERGFDVTFSQILRLMHMRIRIDHMEIFPHGAAPFQNMARLMSVTHDHFGFLIVLEVYYR